MATPTHGGRAKCLQRLVRLDLPVPSTVALSFEMVKSIAAGLKPDLDAILNQFSPDDILCVRPSSESADWGGPSAILNIGMNDARYVELSDTLGQEAAVDLYLRFVQSYSINVARLDPDAFEHIEGQDQAALAAALHAYSDETGEEFPQRISDQLREVLRSMSRAWEGTTARLLREAKGAPADAGLGLVVQKMAFGIGQGESGSGVLQLVDGNTGEERIMGRYARQSQGRDALEQHRKALFLAHDPRGPSLQDSEPEIFAKLVEQAKLMRHRLREEMQIEFTIQNGELFILDGVRVNRRANAAMRIAVKLAEDGIIPQQEALMRIDPRALGELLHRQIDPEAKRDILAAAVAASPGAASGKIVFDALTAQAHAARGEACILVRRETSPEDIRGMHAAAGVLTERGGMTSHAAVIGRGIGLPCVVGASDIKFQPSKKRLTTPDGRTFAEGDIITIDGTNGQVLAGQPKMVEAALDDSFQTFMKWAAENCDIRVRANADTPRDAQTARNFDAQGIGLCRTEHMFFDVDRLTVMREMHEFLPTDRAGLLNLAEALDLPLSTVTQRVESMGEYNPMLGMRGVRLGIKVPEIYEMQARAIFEATVESAEDGETVVPEIMIPLVSAKREVELVRNRIDAVAVAVRNERGTDFTYKLGVMVETPRATLRADDIAQHSAFLSFGTNDLTQMTYGLSRDDAGRFMSDYVNQGVFPEDPFHTLDTEGVGELLRIGVDRARQVDPEIVLSICGEHGGSPESIAFCRQIGMDYVSCSPFRVPVAKLAAAQLAIASKTG
ncbi:MAG: pyruvate, phosphate dikinase [Rhodobacteraceae bacterium]|nr:pyruvate, phosphate dikinase [Paracoccaceae bacterium]